MITMMMENEGDNVDATFKSFIPSTQGDIVIEIASVWGILLFNMQRYQQTPWQLAG